MVCVYMDQSESFAINHTLWLYNRTVVRSVVNGDPTYVEASTRWLLGSKENGHRSLWPQNMCGHLIFYASFLNADSIRRLLMTMMERPCFLSKSIAGIF